MRSNSGQRRSQRALTDLAFIVVARNEADVIARCLSVLEERVFREAEIVLVDSLSVDETGSIMREFAGKHSNACIVSPQICPNAAAARNAGFAASTKKFVIFVDGDVSMRVEFVLRALDELQRRSAGAVTGILEDVIYESRPRCAEVRRKRRTTPPERRETLTLGGIFAARREVINRVGLFDERLYVNEDIDYGFRIAANFKIIELPVIMGEHHTLAHAARPISHLMSGRTADQGMVLRKNILTPGVLREWIKTRKSYVAGMLVSAGFLLLLFFSLLIRPIWSYLVYFVGMVLIAEGAYAVCRGQPLLATTVNLFVAPWMVLWGFLRESFNCRRLDGAKIE